MPIISKIMLVEDHPEYRESLQLVFGKVSHIEISSQFGTAEQALHELHNMPVSVAPNLILLDLNLPGLSGIEALPKFKELTQAPIIVLTQSDDENDIVAAISAGASGYLLKASTKNQLIEAIELVMNGGAPIDPKVAKLILSKLQKKSPEATNSGLLTDREIEVLTLLGAGLLKKQIADKLNLSPHTVGNHIRHIYDKLNVQNSPAAISVAYNKGILEA